MAKFELKEQPAEQLAEFEKKINEIPLVIDPCKMCKIHKANDGYDTGHFDSDGKMG